MTCSFCSVLTLPDPQRFKSQMIPGDRGFKTGVCTILRGRRVKVKDISVPPHERGCPDENVPGLWKQERLRGEKKRQAFFVMAYGHWYCKGVRENAHKNMCCMIDSHVFFPIQVRLIIHDFVVSGQKVTAGWLYDLTRPVIAGQMVHC